MFTPSPKQVAVPHHHVADMNPDPELEAMVLGDVLVCLRECLLHVNSTLDGIDGAGELGQNAITSGIGDPPAVLGDQPIHDLTMGGQGAERPDLVLLIRRE